MKKYYLKNNILYGIGSIRLAESIYNLILKKFNCKSILDIGCGDGIIGKITSNNEKYIGYDINAEIYKINKKNKQVKIIKTNKELSKIKNIYECGLFLDVLEHNIDFLELLDLTINKINKKVVISLPNDANYLNRIRMLFKGKYNANSLDLINYPHNHRHLWFVNIFLAQKILIKFMEENNFILEKKIIHIMKPKNVIKRIIFNLISFTCSKNFLSNGIIFIFQKKY